jgi:hypothetical protein
MFIKTDVEPVMNWLIEIVGQEDCLDSKVLSFPNQSHPGLITPLPGTSEVFFKTKPATDINDNR